MILRNATEDFANSWTNYESVLRNRAFSKSSKNLFRFTTYSVIYSYIIFKLPWGQVGEFQLSILPILDNVNRNFAIFMNNYWRSRE